MSTPAPLSPKITRALDGARILWRRFLAGDDFRAMEGHVREFTRDGDYVRIAATAYRDDHGEWMRTADLRVVAVLEEKVELKTRRRRKVGELWAEGEDQE